MALLAVTSLALGLVGPARGAAAAIPAAAQEAGVLADDYAAAVSDPVEDPYYPRRGDPRIDALHYGLVLHWSARQRVLRGRATIELRAAERTDELVLDLAHVLEQEAASLAVPRLRGNHRQGAVADLQPMHAG